jgi:hypothetical protein
MTRFVSSFIDKLAMHFPWVMKRYARRDAIGMTAELVGYLILARAVDDQGLSEEILREVAGGLRAGTRDSRPAKRAKVSKTCAATNTSFADVFNRPTPLITQPNLRAAEQ